VNYTETIKRAFRIAWKHKSLWLLGFLASLSSGGGSGGNFNTGGGSDGGSGSNQLPSWLDASQIGRWFEQNSATVAALICVLLCVFLVIWLVTLVLGEIGQGGLIANVDGIERGGSPTFGDGWRAGAARVRTLVGMRLLLAIPGILLGAIFVAILVITTVGAAGTALSGQSGEDLFAAILGAGALGFLCIVFPLLCIFAIYSLLVGVLETFGRRAVVLENLGAIDGLKRGWAVFRGKIGDSIVLAILMAVVSFVVGIVVAVPLVVFGVGTAIGAAAFSDSAPWALIAVGILLFIALAVVIGSFFTAVNSAVWTLAYREFTTPPPAPPTPPAIDLLAAAPPPPGQSKESE